MTHIPLLRETPARLSRRLLNGAVAGLVATVPMTAVMAALHRLLPSDERQALPPLEVTVNAARKAGAEKATDTPGEQEVATWVSHFGYGAAMGALYGALISRVRPGPVSGGVLWGMAVWTGSYLGWLPLAGIRAPATSQPPAREVLMVAAHVVFGAATGLAYEALQSGTEPRRDG